MQNCFSEALITVLQTFGEHPQTMVEACRIIPETCVSGRHHLDLRMRYSSLVLIDDGWLDNRIISAMRDHYRLADPR